MTDPLVAPSSSAPLPPRLLPTTLSPPSPHRPALSPEDVGRRATLGLAFIRSMTAVHLAEEIPPWIHFPHLAARRYAGQTDRLPPPMALASSAVQQEHAVRVARTVYDFACFLMDRRLLTTAVALITFLHHRVDRPSVTVPLATARQLAFALSHVLPPRTLKSPVVSSWLTGLERRGRNPMPQPAADPALVSSLILALARLAAPASATTPRMTLTVLLLMASALRTPEAILTMQHGSLSPKPLADPSLTSADVIPAGLKDDKRRAVVNPRPRVLIFRSEWLRLVQSVWGRRLTEEQALGLDATVRRLLHAVGIADVRQLRRLAAVESWRSMTLKPEVQATAVVRAVLGHRDGSQSTFRYVPSRSNEHTRQLLVQAAAARPAAVGPATTRTAARTRSTPRA